MTEQIEFAEIAPTEALIEVRQIPVIVERLKQVKEQVEAMTAEAASLVATADTIQFVKQTRAELRARFDSLEDQRKAVKKAIDKPYDDFLKVYRECITEPFTVADNKLKDEITSFEGELKKACEERLRAYFAELCAAHGVDWITFEKAMAKTGLKISMDQAQAKTPKKLMDALGLFVSDMAVGMDSISKLEDADEIMVEFKKTMNATEAIGIVMDRKKALAAEKEEAERRATEQQRQEEMLRRAKEVAGPEIVKAPVVEAPAPEAKIYKCRFEVSGTKEQLLKLKSYLIKEGLTYVSIK